MRPGTSLHSIVERSKQNAGGRTVIKPGSEGLASGGVSRAPGSNPSAESGSADMPPGTVTMFAGSSTPTGWMVCDGSAVSRTTYAGLFAAIGTTWGVGDGSTTFNVPDLRGRTPIGAGTGSGLTARTLGQTLGSETLGTGVFSAGAAAAVTGTSNMQPSAVMNFIIKA